MTAWSRPVGVLERAWLVAGRRYPPFAIIMIYEGEGSLTRESWERASVAAGAAHPGLRGRLRGAWFWLRWEDTGVAPPVREVDATAWDGTSASGFPDLGVGLDPVDGPVAEIVLLRGPTPRVALRALHAAVDGLGLVAWAEDLGRALRGEPCEHARDAWCDLDLADRVGGDPAPPPPGGVPAPLAGRSDDASPVPWTRRRVTSTSRVLPTVLATLAAAGATRVSVPFDLRRDAGGVRSVGNLTSMVPVALAPDDDAVGIQARIAAARAAGMPARALRALRGLRWLPLWLMTWVSARQASSHHRDGAYGSAAAVSNLGRVEPSAISGAGFSAVTAYIIPPRSPVTPLFLVIVGHAGGAELVASAPEGLAADGRLDALMDRIAAALS